MNIFKILEKDSNILLYNGQIICQKNIFLRKSLVNETEYIFANFQYHWKGISQYEIIKCCNWGEM